VLFRTSDLRREGKVQTISIIKELAVESMQPTKYNYDVVLFFLHCF
jgi:hypothetical protein